MGLTGARALVVTVSDGVKAGTREDLSGEDLARVLEAEGLVVTREVVPDEERAIVSVLEDSAGTFDLILTTGGTGFGPRDVTPEATGKVIDREAPGLVHLMISAGLESTPMAALSRARAGAAGRCLIVNLPGSPRGATEGLTALLPVLPHVLSLLAGDTEHK